MNEIINMSTRILTIYNGSITGDLSYEDISQESIIIHATGGKRNGK
jgi:ribose transport system ATP-binding protein/inositol transport system ATP-binding protein